MQKFKRLTFQEASNSLKEGKLVVIPTETVYGLAADALNVKAIEKIFVIKNRPKFNPLIVHFKNIEQAFEYISEKFLVNKDLEKLINFFLPGPLTLLLPKNNKIPDIVTANLPNIAIRIPSHKYFLDFLNYYNLPLAAPSANTSGRTSPTSAALVDMLLEKNNEVAGIIDGDVCELGLESTIVRIDENNEFEILRAGAISFEQILEKGLKVRFSENIKAGNLSNAIFAKTVVNANNAEFAKNAGNIANAEFAKTAGNIDKAEFGEKAGYIKTAGNIDKAEKTILAPGSLLKHYSPTLPLILIENENMIKDWWLNKEFKKFLNKININLNEICFLAYGENEIDETKNKLFGACLNLSINSNLQEAAHNLYEYFEKESLNPKIKGLVTFFVPNIGLGVSINDRLRRAAKFNFQI